MSYALIAVGVVAALVAWHVGMDLARRAKGKLPPGPPADPIIGHIRWMPMKHAYNYNMEVNNKYGDIASIKAFGKPIILIRKYKDVMELLGKRGAHYSERPKTLFAQQVLGMWRILGVYPYNQDWRELRRVMQTYLGKDSAREQYRPDLEKQAHDFILRSIEADHNESPQYDMAIHKAIIQMAYGIKFTSDDDPILQTSLHMGEVLSAQLLPGKHLVDLFPSLIKLPSWFPLSPWTKQAAEWRATFGKMLDRPYEKVKQMQADGTAKPSFLLSMLEEKNALDTPHIKGLAATTLIAGAETTATLVQGFIFSAMMHPRVQKKAQEEIDRVIGRDRIPTEADIPNLPYCAAIIKEVMRWRPVSPIGLPHESTKDDKLGDFFIPKGSVIVQNAWAMAFDDEIYPNSDQFIPERFMVDDPPMDPKLYSFGIGRRICPGMQVAETMYTPVILAMLATVNIVKARDANGKEITPDGECTGRVANAPKPFPYRILPRSDAHTALLRASVAA